MVKKSSIFTSLLLGAAGGAAAAVFLASKTGKAIREKIVDFANDYKENPDDIHTEFVHKAQDLGKQASEKFTEVKSQLESGDLTVDDLVQTGKEKAKIVKEQSLEKFEEIKEKLAEQNISAEEFFDSLKAKAKKVAKDVTPDDVEEAVSEDIEIEFPEVVEEGS